MFELKKLNVHKIVQTEKEKDMLLNRGYVECIRKEFLENIDSEMVPAKFEEPVKVEEKEPKKGKA
ncbi:MULTISPECIES: hypothetical protein [Clostridium]|uniref:Phage protein n=1 Tax=Clostridium frigoriphilum TaxID=443253 RepID=A0ABU7UIW1_9CLOT|nr:hypothetical protein [Clostridium sp. DSM 17811]MBU3098380.1 hypothetical protein [Clostridium sp. DSM 17811]